MCRRPEATVVTRVRSEVTGRWKTSSERFAQYWGDGQTSLEELEIMRTNNPNFVDPIYAVWRWRPIAFEASLVGGDG